MKLLSHLKPAVNSKTTRKWELMSKLSAVWVHQTLSTLSSCTITHTIHTLLNTLLPLPVWESLFRFLTVSLFILSIFLLYSSSSSSSSLYVLFIPSLQVWRWLMPVRRWRSSGRWRTLWTWRSNRTLSTRCRTSTTKTSKRYRWLDRYGIVARYRRCVGAYLSSLLFSSTAAPFEEDGGPPSGLWL